jgi:hypothetical protein
LTLFWVLAGLLVVVAARTPQEVAEALVRMRELHASPTLAIDAQEAISFASLHALHERVTGGVFLRSRKPAPDPLSLTGVRTLSATNTDKSRSSRST